MKLRTIAAALFCFCIISSAVQAEEEVVNECSCQAEAAEVSSLKDSLAAKEQQATDLLKQIESLKSDLSAATSKQNQAKTDLSDAQTRLKSLESELSNTESKLKSAENKLATARKELTVTEQASKDTVNTCQLTLKKVQSDLSDQAARLAELRALEEALLPLWLSHRIDSTTTFAKAQLEQLQKSDLYGQAVSKVAPYWEQLMTATKPAREAAAVQFQKAQEFVAKLPVQDAINSAKQQASNIEHELHIVIKHFFSSQPALASLNDPVTIQLLVYSIMGLPVALLSLLLLSLVGGPGRSAKNAAAAAGKGAGTTASGKKGSVGSKGKPVVQQTPAGKGKKGKAFKDGADVLYTP